MINYLIEAAFVHAILMLIYYVGIRHETQYRIRRGFILSAAVLSLAVPFISIPLPSPTAPLISQAENYILLDGVTIGGESPSEITISSATPFSWASMIVKLYWLVAGVLFTYLLISLFQIARLYGQSTRHKYQDITIRKHKNIKHSFSFFGLIFCSEENDNIISHELAHANLWHSADVLFLSLYRVMMWWSPSAWVALSEIKMIHEYQADERAAGEDNFDEYRKTLISTAMASVGLNLASSFHTGAIKKRLHAMKQTKKRISQWKIGVLGTLVAMVVLTFSCSEELDNEIKKMGDESSIAMDYPQEVMDALESLKSEDPEASYTVVEYYGDEDRTKKLKQYISQKGTAEIHIVTPTNGENPYMILKEGNTTYDLIVEKTKNDQSMGEEVFTIVENQPSFDGGMPKYYEYVAQNLKYPTSAKEEGVEGRVFVQFIVEKDGSLSNVQVVKGVDPRLDKAAVSTIMQSPKFSPGMQAGKLVRVRMVLPIIFSLGGDDGDISKSDVTHDPIVEEIVYEGDH